ncbi:hypothetical protein FKB36_00330 [Methanoculleus sp. Afa-1]|uniref:Uncharacterized protein n=1 Tax=Methanoculleus formosensis TaxID=2590886 RepID=A0A9E5DED3_9EURY|nr:hypothetical protein [Methanoculleus sp. Afa-1]
MPRFTTFSFLHGWIRSFGCRDMDFPSAVNPSSVLCEFVAGASTPPFSDEMFIEAADDPATYRDGAGPSP